MNKLKNEYVIKEQIFLLYMFFFTMTSILGVIFDNINWLFFTVPCTIIAFLSIKKIYTNIIHRVGIYSLLFIAIPILLYFTPKNISLNITLTILSFILMNYIINKNERIILNILDIILISILFILTKPVSTFGLWNLGLPFTLAFIGILLIIIDNFNDIERSDNKQRELQLTRLTLTDHLTGLYNRKYMEQKLKSIHSVWKRGVQTYSLIMLDIDYFKLYNDFYGHIQGDNCLKIISSILQEQITRDTDYAFRYGGEEFLIILGFTDSSGATLVANRIKDAIKNAKIPHEKSTINENITISMGIATIDETYDSFAELLTRTDKALYLAKDGGRNQIVHYKKNLTLT